MKLTRRLAAALAVPALALGAGVAVAGSAHAATPVVDTTGVIGYQAVQNGNVTYYTHETSYFGLGDPQYSVNNPQLPVNPLLAAELHGLSVGTWHSFSNPAGVVVKAARLGLCGGAHSFNDGTTVQELIVPVSATTFDVVALEGQFPGAVSGGDVCLNPTLPTGMAAVVLRNIPDADTVQLDLLFDGLHAHNGTGAGHATFVGTDLTHPTANTVSTPHPVFSHNGGNSEFYEAEAGVLGVTGGNPTSGLAGPVLPDVGSPNMVVREAHVGLNGNTIGGSEVHGTLQSDTAWTAVPDATEHNGLITGAVSVFAADHFSNYVAPGVFPLTPAS